MSIDVALIKILSVLKIFLSFLHAGCNRINKHTRA